MIRDFFRKLGARLRAEFTFHFFIDVTTLIASIATVVALVILIHDRPEQANIAAWQLLQNYLQGDKRAGFDEGQSFALETLTKNRVSLLGLDAHGIFLRETHLQRADIGAASFENAQLFEVDFTDASFIDTSFEGANLRFCRCHGVDFLNANLRGAVIFLGDYRGALFPQADISDLQVFSASPAGGVDRFDRDMFEFACYQKGHEPRFSHDKQPGYVEFKPPADPQGKDCIRQWGAKWSGKVDANGNAPNSSGH